MTIPNGCVKFRNGIFSHKEKLLTPFPFLFYQVMLSTLLLPAMGGLWGDWEIDDQGGGNVILAVGIDIECQKEKKEKK